MRNRVNARKFVILCSTIFLAATLTACRKQDPRKLVFIIVPSQDNPFFKSEADAAAARAESLGYRTRIDAHNDDAYRQDNLVDAAIASNASVLILDNAGADSSVSAVRRAAQAGIAVFLIDREIDATGFAKAQIIADNHQGSQVVAQEFARSMNQHGDYAELLGRESDTNAQIRTQGFHAVLDTIPGLKMVAAQSANWSQAEAFSKTETMLQAHSSIAGIVAGNDTMALGAAAAVKSAGLKNIRIVGFDGSPDAIAAIRDGEMQATALQPAVDIARLAVDQADRFLKTGSTGQPELQIIPCDLVTKSNAADFGNFEKLR
jgi:erythritol transport system substrate-binding protein